MARKLRLVKGASRRGALVYGMRIFDEAHVDAVEDAKVTLADGSRGGSRCISSRAPARRSAAS